MNVSLVSTDAVSNNLGGFRLTAVYTGIEGQSVQTALAVELHRDATNFPDVHDVHCMHTMLELAVQKDETYCPLLQVPQALQLAALDVVEKLVPAMQGVHTVLAVVLQTLLR